MTHEYNFGTRYNNTKYTKEGCVFGSGQKFFLKIFSTITFRSQTNYQNSLNIFVCC